MDFQDLNTPEGLRRLNEHLATRSYISGHEPTQNDVLVFRSTLKEPPSKAPTANNVKRWHLHLKSFSVDDMKSFPQAKEKVKVSSQNAGGGGEVKHFYSVCI